MKTTKLGYVKVSVTQMCNEVLSPIHVKKLLSVHYDEVKRIERRNDRTNYISKAQLEYITNLYTDVVLNCKTFKPVKKASVNKMSFQHIGMQKLMQYGQV